MLTHHFLLQLVIILFTARLLGECAAYFKIPSVIGELLAGVLLGPSLLNLIPLSETLRVLSEIGIVLLLFEVGMQTSLPQLMDSGKEATYVAITGVIAPFLLGVYLSYYVFHLELLPSLFVGGTLTATSIGITMRVLTELQRQSSKEAQIVLGAAILDDIIGIVFLAVLYEFSISGRVDPWGALQVSLLMCIFLITAPPLVKGISILIRAYETKSEIPGLLPSVIVALILLCASLAHQFGAPVLLGGFAAGLALSPQFSLPYSKYLGTDPEFSRRVAKQMKPIIHLFTPIFFVHIGLLLNLRAVEWSSSFVWTASASLLLVAIVGKLIAGLSMWDASRYTRWIVGISMIPRGEVGLIFAGMGLENQVLNEDLYAALIVVIALTTVMAPCLMRWFYQKFEMQLQKGGVA